MRGAYEGNGAIESDGAIGGIGPLFRIGLSAIPENKWLEFCADDEDFLSEKARLFEARLADVFVQEEGTGAAQGEVLQLIQNAIKGRERNPIVIYDSLGSDLLRAASLVAEDLVIMRRGETGWRLAAGVVCFPSDWRLADKFAQPIGKIHGPVPGFGQGGRNDMMINRIFDRMEAGAIVERFNWSLVGDDALAHFPKTMNSAHNGGRKRVSEEGEIYLRTERQTLRKLPESGDILFTIRIHIDGLSVLPDTPRTKRAFDVLVNCLEEMDEAQLAYKGYGAIRQVLLARLKKIRNAPCADGGTQQQAES